MISSPEARGGVALGESPFTDIDIRANEVLAGIRLARGNPTALRMWPEPEFLAELLGPDSPYTNPLQDGRPFIIIGAPTHNEFHAIGLGIEGQGRVGEGYMGHKVSIQVSSTGEMQLVPARGPLAERAADLNVLTKIAAEVHIHPATVAEPVAGEVQVQLPSNLPNRDRRLWRTPSWS